MKITIQNYKQLRPSFDLSKLPKATKEPFELIDNDFDDFLELYTDSDPAFNDIRKGMDNHIEIVNKYLVDAPKKAVVKPTKAVVIDAKKPISKEAFKKKMVKVIDNKLKENKKQSSSKPKFKHDELVYLAESLGKKEFIKVIYRINKHGGYFDLKSNGSGGSANDIDSVKKFITQQLEYLGKRHKVLKDKIFSISTETKKPLGRKSNREKTLENIAKNPPKSKPKFDFGDRVLFGIKKIYVKDRYLDKGVWVYKTSDNEEYVESMLKKQPASKPKTTQKKESPCDEAIENYLENKKEAREKASAKSKRNRIKNALDKENVNFYNAEFRLLRRFKNLVTKKGNATFRSVQLLYMAFQKHSVARKVRKSSDLANLYEICNKKLTKLYEAIAPKKQNVNITFSDKDVLEQLKKLVDNKKVDYAISLMNRVINIQGTAPEDKKVERLISSIENAFKNGRVDERSRLYDDLVKAKKELKRYVDDKIEKIPTTNYGLSGVKKKDVIAATINKKAPNTITMKGVTPSHPIAIHLPPQTPQKAVVTNVDKMGFVDNEQVNQKPPATTNATETPQQPKNKVVSNKKVPPQKGVLSTNEIMNMQFDTLPFTGKWYDFMQSPAKNMRIAFQGKPKNGKTSGCMALANVLTNYGNVLYNFADQGINKSTQDLWKLSGLAEKSNAFITDTRDLKELDKLCKSGNYDFVFIDMINTYIHRTGIKYFEFEDRFLKKYPNISFILVFEATKSGDFKGDQGWTHLVDAIVNVENYVLHNNGRYGVGDYVVWKEGLKRTNPKKYKEFFKDHDPQPENKEIKTITMQSAY